MSRPGLGGRPGRAADGPDEGPDRLDGGRVPDGPATGPADGPDEGPDAGLDDELDGDLVLGAPATGPDAGLDDELDGDLVLGAPAHERERRRGPVVPDHVPRDALDEDATRPATGRARARAALVALRQSLRRRARRARGSAPAILVTALTCGAAYLLSTVLLGQPYPIFAPIIVWIALGFVLDRPPRRVAELGLGSTLGVLMGEAMVTLFGQGLVQVMAVIVVSALVARFLDSADLFTSQAAVQSLVVTSLPAALLHGGAFGRWSEALLGCTLAFIVAVLLRRDVGRKARQQGSSVLSDLAEVLDATATGLAAGDRRRVDDALAMGRGTQSAIDDWQEAAKIARDIVRVNPTLWSRRRAADDEVHAAEMGDRAVRNARVVARLSSGVADAEGASPVVAGHVHRLATAARLLAQAHRADQVPTGAREVLESVSRELSPTHHALGGWRAQMVESLLRSLAVDLLQVAGVTHGEASGLLPHGRSRPAGSQRGRAGAAGDAPGNRGAGAAGR